jgi:hypothetical protein
MLYSLIFGQSGEKEEPAQGSNPALVHFQWTSLLFRFRNGETAAHIFVGSGSSQRLLVQIVIRALHNPLHINDFSQPRAVFTGEKPLPMTISHPRGR